MHLSEDAILTRIEKARRAIRAADTESEVIAAVRGYLDSLDKADAALLPAEILVMTLAPAEELIQMARQSLEGCLSSRPKGGVLKEVNSVFTSAARRLEFLARRKS